MKAVEIKRIGYAELVEMERPKAGPGEVLVRVHATGICGSDLAAYLGRHPYRIPPVVTGHEVAGIVEAVGEGVAELGVGEPVIIEPHVGCGQCFYCESGDYNLCKQKRVLGTTSWPGSFAEYVVVPAPCAYKVPSDIPFSVVTLLEPLCVGLHAAGKASLKPGATVAILGSGTIGLTLLLAVLQSKPSKVICSDIRRRNLDMALSLGATHAIDPREKDITEEVHRITDDCGMDTCFIAVPSDQVVAQALAIARPKGTIVLIALFEEPSRVDLSEIQLRERQLIGTLMYTRQDYLKAVELLPSLRDSLAKLITHHVSIEQLPDMLDALSHGRVEDSIKVVVDMV
jgi:L-iditol 2-dehydrogenase